MVNAATKHCPNVKAAGKKRSGVFSHNIITKSGTVKLLLLSQIQNDRERQIFAVIQDIEAARSTEVKILRREGS